MFKNVQATRDFWLIETQVQFPSYFWASTNKIENESITIVLSTYHKTTSSKTWNWTGSCYSYTLLQLYTSLNNTNKTYQTSKNLDNTTANSDENELALFPTKTLTSVIFIILWTSLNLISILCSQSATKTLQFNITDYLIRCNILCV